MTKSTVLLNEHIKLGAKLVPFAGWTMPVQYKGIAQEHNAVRQSAGLFDVSHMGEFFVEGKDAAKFLTYLVPQDIEAMPQSKVTYCQLTNESGGIIDDLLIYKMSDEKFLLVVNASRLDVDFDWITSHKGDFDVKIENKSDEYSLIAIQGPNASAIMDKVGFKKEDQPEFMNFTIANIYGQGIFVSSTGYTGEKGFEILVKNEDAPELWSNLLDDGKEFALEPIGLGARDTLRLEAALPLYGHELTETTTPVEAGLKWSIPSDKKADYLGKKVIAKQLENGVKKRLVGFQLTDRGIARAEDKVFVNGNLTGIVTSGTMSPISKVPFGLAYVDDSNLKIDSQFQVEIRGKMHFAKIVRRPFIVKAYAK